MKYYALLGLLGFFSASIMGADSVKTADTRVQRMRDAADRILNRGVICHALGRYSKAVQQYRDAYAQYVTLGDRYGMATALFNLGLLHYDQRRFDSAICAYRESAYKGSVAAMNNLGDLLTFIAATKLRNARQQDVKNLLFRQAEYVEAQHWYEQAAQTGDPIAMNNLGNMYFEQGNFGGAVKLWDEAIKKGNSAAQKNILMLANIDLSLVFGPH